MHSLNCNRLGAEGGAALAPALAANGALTELCIYGNGVGDEGVGAICESIQSNKETKLASLNFGDNGIGPVGANALAAMVAVTGSLTELSIYGNHVGDEGVCAICEAIQSNKETKLTSLNFGNNGVGPVGATALAAVVAVTGSLTELSIYGNRVGDEGVCAICEAIQSNKETKLASLNFGENHIGPVGANAVAAMVAVTGALTELFIYGNRVGDEGVRAICESIQSNKETKLASLNFGNNGIGPVGANALAAMVAVTGALTKMRYVTFRSAPSSHILPLTLPTALCNLTTRPLLPSVCVQP